MNYLLEINRFYGWLTTHPLSPQSQALWNLLMNIDNRAGWPAEFAVSSGMLTSCLKISRTQLSRCRRELTEAGRIVHTLRKGGQAPLYHLLAFETEKAAGGVNREPPPPRKHLPANSPHRLNRVNLHLVQ